MDNWQIHSRKLSHTEKGKKCYQFTAHKPLAGRLTASSELEEVIATATKSGSCKLKQARLLEKKTKVLSTQPQSLKPPLLHLAYGNRTISKNCCMPLIHSSMIFSTKRLHPKEIWGPQLDHKHEGGPFFVACRSRGQYSHKWQ